ncbi:MAG: murein biosynthesis integral membrane protein MurJ [Clostridia bacterium]|nr:murein biosynthesis integral membrane protein MurJ [Clostridia bacterium]
MSKKNIRSTAFMIMLSVLLSRILGFFRTALIPIKMGGLSDVSDAYNAAFQIPDLMYGLLVGGAIAASLIPILSGFVEKEQEKKGWSVVSSYINMMMIIMFAFTILGVVFAPQLMSLVASGFKNQDPSKMELTIRLTRILMPISFFMMLSGLCNGILNSYSKFAVAAFGPTFYNLACVLSILFLSNDDAASNYGVDKVVIGIVICSFLYFILQFAFAAKYFKNYKPHIEVHDPDFTLMIKLAVPSLLTSALMQLNMIVSKSYTTQFDSGSLSALELANRTWQMPLGIIAQAVGVAVLPGLSGLFANNKHGEYEKRLNTSLRLVLFLGIPSAFAFAVFSQSIVQLMFNFNNSLTYENVQLTGAILTFYSVALIAQCVNTIMNRAYYSTKNSMIPFWGGSISIGINFLLAYLITMYTSAGPKGIALAYSIATVINMTILISSFKKRIPGYKISKNFPAVGKMLVSSLIMALAVYLSDTYLMKLLFHGSMMDISKMMQALWVILTILIGVLIYVIISYLLRIEECTDLVKSIKNKLKKIGNK